jgi:hypothetical protein
MSFTSYAVHFMLALVCVALSARPTTLRDLIYIRPLTRVGIQGFLLLTAAAQTLVVLGDSGTTASAVLDALRILALVGLAVGLYLDQQRAAKRLANALAAITDKLDGLAVVNGYKGREMIESGEAQRLAAGKLVAATVNHALLDPDDS